MKIGDKVRFLSEVGGGVVAGFQGKNIVLVEDEDGFQIPTSITDVVVIDNDDYNIKHDVQNVSTVKDEDEDYDPADRPVTFTAQPEERKGGDALSVYLGFVPVDIKEITNTKFEVYLINDSNYYIDFTYLTVEGTSWNLRSKGTVEPNTKLFIEEFGREVLNELERVAVQFVAYKKDKGFLLKPAVDAQLRIDTVKFYKLHTFQENDFFEQSALIYTLIENDKPVRPLVVDAKNLKWRWLERRQMTTNRELLFRMLARSQKTNLLLLTCMLTSFLIQLQECLLQIYLTINLMYSERPWTAIWANMVSR